MVSCTSPVAPVSSAVAVPWLEVAAAVHVTALLDGAVCYLFAEATRQ